MKINKQDIFAKFDDILLCGNESEVFLFIDSLKSIIEDLSTEDIVVLINKIYCNYIDSSGSSWLKYKDIVLDTDSYNDENIYDYEDSELYEWESVKGQWLRFREVLLKCMGDRIVR